MLKKNKNNPTQTFAVGSFTQWLNELIGSLEGQNDTNVPCGECVACCTSSYFIHLKPTDKQTLRHIPKNIIFPAPGLPKGHFLLGYDENGHCPMFKENKCSIYNYRPETCRQYDCRVYAATGFSLENEKKPLISSQTKHWKFDISSASDAEAMQAVKLAAKFITEHYAYFPAGFIPSSIPQQAIMAIRIYTVFIGLSQEKIDGQVKELVKSVVLKFDQKQ